jgi:hypothetical protein
MSYFGEDSNITGNLNIGTLQLISGAITDSSGSISFGSNNVSTTGNIGIGTNNPLDELSISGTIPYVRVLGDNNVFGFYGGGNANPGSGASNPWMATLSGTNKSGETIASATYGWLFHNRSSDGNLTLSRRNNSTTDTNVMTFSRSNGNVGIGTINPQYKLDVNGGFLRVRDATSTTIGNSIFRSDSLELGMNRSADGLSYIDFHGSVGSDYDFRCIRGSGTNEAIQFINVGTGNMVFATNSTNAMIIDGTGNVGIGTPTPNKKLTILTNADYAEFNLRSNGQEMLFGCQTSGSRCYIQARTIGESNNYLTLNPNGGNVGIRTATPYCLLDLGNSYGSGDTARKLALYYDGTYFAGFGMSGSTMEFSVDAATGVPPQMVLNGSGAVGIGTTAPAEKLHIEGGNIGIQRDQNISWGINYGSPWAVRQTSADNKLRFRLTATDYIYFKTDGRIDAVGFDATSDDRLKENEIFIENGTDTIMKLRPQKYLKKPTINSIDENDWFLESGLIAQEIYYDAPELRHIITLPDDVGDITKPIISSDNPNQDPDYSEWGTTPASVGYIQLIPYLIKSIQEQQEVINNLLERIEALENF